MAKDGKEYIIEVNDSATTLMGESQEDDRRNIAEMILNEMEVTGATEALPSSFFLSFTSRQKPKPVLNTF